MWGGDERHVQGRRHLADPMLVLSRNVGEAIRIGDNVVLRVLEIKDGRVRIGFEAPLSVEIWREEIPFDDDSATSG